MIEVRKINTMIAKYFDGEVVDLKNIYRENSVYTMTIFYRRNDLYSYEYQVVVDEKTNSIQFDYHTCHCQLEIIHLQEDKGFENELMESITLM